MVVPEGFEVEGGGLDKKNKARPHEPKNRNRGNRRTCMGSQLYRNQKTSKTEPEWKLKRRGQCQPRWIARRNGSSKRGKRNRDKEPVAAC